MGERRDIADGRRGSGSVGSGGGCALAMIGIVTLMFCDRLRGLVCVVHAWAGNMARKTAERVVVCATAVAGFQLLATEATGEQVG